MFIWDRSCIGKNFKTLKLKLFGGNDFIITLQNVICCLESIILCLQGIVCRGHTIEFSFLLSIRSPLSHILPSWSANCNSCHVHLSSRNPRHSLCDTRLTLQWGIHIKLVIFLCSSIFILFHGWCIKGPYSLRGGCAQPFLFLVSRVTSTQYAFSCLFHKLLWSSYATGHSVNAGTAQGFSLNLMLIRV